MRIIITVDRKIYRQAVKDGWKRRTEEDLPIEEFKSLDNKSDLIWAMPNLNE